MDNSCTMYRCWMCRRHLGESGALWSAGDVYGCETRTSSSSFQFAHSSSYFYLEIIIHEHDGSRAARWQEILKSEHEACFTPHHLEIPLNPMTPHPATRRHTQPLISPAAGLATGRDLLGAPAKQHVMMISCFLQGSLRKRGRRRRPGITRGACGGIRRPLAWD